jgi:RND family efflux transporter MFP subunit
MILTRFAPACAVLVLSGTALARQPSYECLIEPLQTVALRSTVPGSIETIQAHRGESIRKGAVLVTLESSAERATLDLAHYKAEMTGAIVAAQTKHDYAERKFIRRRDMNAEKLMSTQDKEEAEGDMKSAEADLQVARENHEVARLEYEEQKALLLRRTLRSPFDGVVADQLQYEGEVVEPSDPTKPILKLEKIDPLRVHVILPRTVFGQIKLGMTGTVAPEAPMGNEVTGVVTVLDSVVDGASGTFSAYLDLPNPKHRIPAGIRCQASFAAAAKE